MMNRRAIDIFAVATITIIVVALALVLPSVWVAGRILALPLALVLPGYAVISALYSKQPPGLPERFLFSVGISLSIAILGGLLLNLTPFGLRTWSWAVLLGSISIVSCAIALLRRRGQNGVTSAWSGFGEIGFTYRQVLLFGLAAVVLGGAIAVSVIGAQRQPRPGFTQLWILPAGGDKAKDGVRLGVKNMELVQMQYRLVVTIDGKEVKDWEAINLARNNTWETTLMLSQAGKPHPAKVEALLYRKDAPIKIYRYVTLWLTT